MGPEIVYINVSLEYSVFTHLKFTTNSQTGYVNGQVYTHLVRLQAEIIHALL